MPQLAADKEAADAELRAILRQLKDDNGLTFDQLVDRAQLSRGTIGHYLNKPGHPRKTELLQQLLAALGASTQERERALALHRRTLRDGSDSAEVGWAARAKAAECTV